VIDANGMTMMPGLIDLHVHLMILGHGKYVEWFPYMENNRKKVMRISAKQLLDAGVTTAADMGAPLEILDIRDRIEEGAIPGPRMLVSGPWITRSAWDELGMFFQYRIESPEEAARRAQELVDEGVDLIKTWSGMQEEDIRAVADVAHENDVQVHSHLYSPEAIRGAIDGGTDVIQHAGSAGVPPYDHSLVKEIAQKAIPVVPTIAHRIWIYPATRNFPERLDDPKLRKDFPPEIYKMVRESYNDGNIQQLSYFDTTPREIRHSEQAARQFIEANAMVAMGTDSGTPLNFHTEAAWREISAMVDSGMSPLQAISASTHVAAKALNIDDKVGTIEAGKKADIIAVDGNPLFDINVLRRVEHVIRDGRIHK